jgi:hypothetical protein
MTFDDISRCALEPLDVPKPALDAASPLLIDTLGVAAGATRLNVGKIARDHAVRLKSAARAKDDATLLFGGHKPSMTGPDQIGLMKSGVILADVSRGTKMRQTAVDHALASGTIAGAVLDVFEVGPLPTTSPLRDWTTCFCRCIALKSLPTETRRRSTSSSTIWGAG